ncbi:winged helix family transcriptional regulator [Catenibacterium mitsuokai]|jgi:DNA-binding response OmpR family regulator|uniref:winged helix-turn-helix domain-containing protein n=1 Tax=Coprobacillaceae TaxID=2810280 RepID=UPI00192AD8BE|nr:MULTISPECIES: winged helix-turn-helix domain-containing protein [Coprobacillaceae]MBT9813853.1 winged helix family transcriptional regulator [Catenibacterium mitsuokai]MCR1948732.1 winged helix-turn-helix domain-containing protein [Thomasclavelia ramosa]QQY26145.1 winged helix-turn-helix transcriptional regulator [Thomasclavelia ramosa]
MSKLIKQLKEDKSVDLLYDSDEENEKVFKFDLIQNKVTKNGIEIHLTKSEFEVFKLFCFHSGQVFSKERLYELIWNEKSNSCFHAIENMISRLRKKVEDDPLNPKYIVTVRGFGYKFIEKEN